MTPGTDVLVRMTSGSVYVGCVVRPDDPSWLCLATASMVDGQPEMDHLIAYGRGNFVHFEPWDEIVVIQAKNVEMICRWCANLPHPRRTMRSSPPNPESST